MTPRKPMDPFARRMVLGAVVYGGVMLAMFAVLTAVYLHTHPRCNDRVVADSMSPGKQWAATMMERRCGEDTPFFTHINLRAAGQAVQRGIFSGIAEEGEVFLLEQDAAGTGLSFQWSAPDRLVISCAHCDSSLERKHETRWGDITISYQPQR